LPPWAPVDARAFDNTGTTSGIMGLSLPLAVRVALTVLKKVYLQAGSGRKESALRRGLDDRARNLVTPVLAALQAEGLVLRRIHKGETIWHPDRSAMPRIQRILEQLCPDDDNLARRLEDLTR